MKRLSLFERMSMIGKGEARTGLRPPGVDENVRRPAECQRPDLDLPGRKADRN